MSKRERDRRLLSRWLMKLRLLPYIPQQSHLGDTDGKFPPNERFVFGYHGNQDTDDTQGGRVWPPRRTS